MKKYIFFSTIVAAALMTGCGNTNDTTSNTLSQPHNTLNSVRAVNIETDWTWFVDMQRLDVESNQSKFGLVASFEEGIPIEVAHLQYFLDTDNNASTGFSGTNGWQIRGADYLIEDGAIFKSQNNHAWQWQYIGKFDTYNKEQDTLGMVEITMQTSNPKLQKIFSVPNGINVAIEPFDKAWQGVYDTIFPIEIMPKTAVVADYVQSLKNLLKERYIAATSLSSNYAIVTHIKDGYKTYTFYDISDPANPKAESTLVQEDDVTKIKYLHIIDDTRLEYTKITTPQNLKVIYDYLKRKVISEKPISALDAQTIRQKLIDDGKITQNDSIKYLFSPDNNYLFIVLDLADDTRYTLYAINGNTLSFVKDLTHIQENPDTFKMIDNQTLSYTTTTGRYKKRTTHIYNYMEDKEVKSYMTDKDSIEYQLRLNHTGYGRTLLGFLYSSNMDYVVAHASFRSKENLTVYDITEPQNVIKQVVKIDYNTDDKHYGFSQITFKDQHTITFVLTELKFDPNSYKYLPTEKSYLVTYDLQNKKEISKESR